MAQKHFSKIKSKIGEFNKNRDTSDTVLKIKAFMKTKKAIAGLIILIMAAVMLTAYLYNKYHKYKDYKILSSIKVESADNSKFVSFGKFVVKYSNDGISYIDGEETVWDEAYEMKSPLIDVCEGYLAIADKNTNDIYIYDEDGRKGKVSVSYPIIKLQVAKQGVVAALQEEKDANYIEAYDIEGNQLISHKTLIDERGYPLNFSLSNDGSDMMVSYLSVNNGTFSNKVVFYDFSKDGDAYENRISGNFEQYEETLVPTVEYVSDDYAIAIGENVISIYDVSGKPKLKKEIKINHQIEKVFMNEEYVGITYAKENNSNTHVIEAYNMKGKKKLSTSTYLNFEQIDFAGENVILYDDLNCELISFAGVKKFQYTFKGTISEIIPLENAREFLLMTNSEIQKIRLK